MVVALFLLLAPIEIHSQSKDPRAVNLFNQAAQEDDINKKIAAYKQVVQIDPLFVEALFNIGVLYKQQQDFNLAEQYLVQASRLSPGRTQYELRGRILYELAGVYKRSGKLKESEESLRAAKPLVIDKELRSMISFDLGRLLFEQKRLDEAFSELKDGQKLSAKNKTFFTNFILAAEQGLELQKLYDSARQAEAGGRLSEARAIYATIHEKNSNYEDVEERLANVDSLLSPETQRKQALAAKYQQAGRHVSEGKFDLAIAVYESILQEAGEYKDVSVLLGQARQQSAAQQRQASLDGEYAAGSAALHAQNWTRAIITFERILAIDENYRDARRLLEQAQTSLERESTESICVRYYADGVAAMNQNDLGGALAAFEKVKRLNPNYRDLSTLLGVVERELQNQSSAATANFNSAAVSTSASSGLANAPSAPITPSPAADGSGTRVIYLAGAFAAVIVLPLLGFMFFSSTGRARLYLFLGNYAATMRIYENMLIRHPERARLNPTVINTLATYYLLERRMDERALDVYQQVQRLNLPTAHREEINSILQQQYLTAGRNTTDAAERLEQMLKTKTSRIESSK
jgi:tetratricopeptide (TPR) repeat protein